MKIEHNGNFVLCRFDEREIEETRQYWTPDRFQQTRPIEMPTSLYSLTMPPSQILVPARADISKRPYLCGGKLFFYQSGDSFHGSAQFMGDDRIILTAGHCIFEATARSWNVGHNFARGYHKKNSVKDFSVNALVIREEFFNAKSKSNEYWKFDYGFLLTTTPSDVGHLDYTLTSPTIATSWGYPGNYDNGKIMQTVSGALEEPSRNGCWYMPGNPYGGGSSGGAWTNADHQIFSLNSFGPSNPTVYGDYMAGPVFDEKFEELYKFALEHK